MGLKLYGLSILNFNKYKNYFYLIIVFFIYILLISIINYLPILDQNDLNKDRLIKFFIFKIFNFISYNSKIVSENQFRSKYLYISTSIITLILGCDLILQFYTGSNLLGFTSEFDRHYPGLFKDEPVAGHYLQRFSPLVLFYLSFFYLKKSFKQSDLIFFSSKYIFLF